MLKYEILSILVQQQGQIVTGGALGEQLGVSRTAIWKAIGSLLTEGFIIETFKNSGYKFISDNDVLSAELIRNNLTSKILGNQIEILKTVDSTNLYLKRQDLSNISEGYLVVTNEQTAGRGRFDRTFYSLPKEGIYMSLLLKPIIEPTHMQFFTICVALSVCRAIEKVCGIEVDIKWVNDILYKNKKLCGILTEAVMSAETQKIEYIVIGIGINTGEIHPNVNSIATSIYKITNKYGFKNRLIAETLNQLEDLYISFTNPNERLVIMEEYTKKLSILNQTIHVNNFKDTFEATVIGIRESGALIVKDSQGNIIDLQSGEVTLKKD